MTKSIVGFLLLENGRYRLISWEAVNPQEIEVELEERGEEPLCDFCQGTGGSPFAPEGFHGGTCPKCKGEIKS